MLNRKMLTYIILVLGLVITLGIRVEADNSLSHVLPGFQQYQITIITPKGEEEYDYLVSFSVDSQAKNINVYTDGAEYKTNSFYDLDLNLISSEMIVTSEEDIERVGFNRRTADCSGDGSQINIDFYLADDLQLSRVIHLKEQAVEFEVLGLYLQALLLQNSTDFHGQLIDINGIGRYELDSKVLTVREIKKLAAGRHMAWQVKEILDKADDIYVFSIGYNGMLSWFFPARFHVVLEKQTPHRILAFWGGSSDLLRYHVYTYQK